MTIEEEIITRLTGFGGLTALVGTRIRPVKKRTDIALPAITYQVISEIRQPAFGNTPKNVAARWQFSIWAKKYSETRTIKTQLIAALQRFRQSTGTAIEDIFIENTIDLFEDDTKQYHLAIDVQIFYIEA